MIAEGITRAQRNFDAYLEENIDINWGVQRKKIYEHFGLVPRGSEKLSDSTSYPSPGIKGSFGRSTRGGRGSTAERQRQGASSRSVFGRSGMQKSVIGTPGVGIGNAMVFGDGVEKYGQNLPVQDDRFLREKQANFAQKVQRLNEARLKDLCYPVLQEFGSVEGQAGGDVSNMHCHQCYYLITRVFSLLVNLLTLTRR